MFDSDDWSNDFDDLYSADWEDYLGGPDDDYLGEPDDIEIEKGNERYWSHYDD